MAGRHWSEAKRLRPVEVVEDYDKTIHDELDLMREAANAAQLRHNFLDSDLIYVRKSTGSIAGVTLWLWNRSMAYLYAMSTR
ncbi:MAG: hypothetical protein Ct9H300mP14_01320 [Gammaproteobacteria bacterium]|nr:MAG: hypothetical protein Ct9H300mP14_01320 [Gammaproteobacteria bacterium]